MTEEKTRERRKNELIKRWRSEGYQSSFYAMALDTMAEDQLDLDDLRKRFKDTIKRLNREAKERGEKVEPGRSLTVLSVSRDGRRLLGSIRELTTSLIVQRRELGLTPASQGNSEGEEVAKLLCRKCAAMLRDKGLVVVRRKV